MEAADRGAREAGGALAATSCCRTRSSPTPYIDERIQPIRLGPAPTGKSSPLYVAQHKFVYPDAVLVGNTISEHKCIISDPPLASWEGEIGGGM